MRILYIHNDYGTRSGEEAAAEGLARLLTDRGHEIFWFRRSSAEMGYSLAGKAKAFLAGIHNPFAARALGDGLDEIRPDLVQVQNIYPLLSPSIFKPIKARGVPIVMRCPNYRLFCPNGLHSVRGEVCERCLGFGREAWCMLKSCEGSFFKSMGYGLRNAWARISGGILRNVDMFIVQTTFQKEKFIGNGIPEERIGIVPGLIPSVERAESSDPGNLISFVGRVSPEKGIQDFLAAARLLPDVPFAVAGSENGMPGLREESPANVRWLGFLQTDGLHELYRRSRIVVVPSRWYEGFPNVAVQAMAQARPVVAARIGAMTSVVDEERTGVFFEVCNPRDLAAKLRRLYADPRSCRTLGEAGREKALRLYSRGSVYSALIAIYEKAVRHGRNLA